MDAALRRPANLGFLILALGFFIIPGTWTFHLALVTGYAHGVQGMYGGYKSGRFPLWQVLLACAAIYPLTLMPHLILVMMAAVFSTLHFVTDEFHLYKARLTALTKTVMPGLLTLLLGALIIFFRATDKATVLSLAAVVTLACALLFIRKIETPTAPESGVLILFLALIFAVAFLENDRTSAVVHLMGLMHFWSWYVEFYQRSQTKNRSFAFLRQSFGFFAAFAGIGVIGWYFENPLALQLLDARLYFAWIIVHCVLSFRLQDVAAWIPSLSSRFDKKELGAMNSLSQE
jgi:hypothetical protein